jgi:hypothetical protein
MNDTWNKIRETVGKIAPVLGNAIVPGIGGAAGSLLASVLGVENTPDTINSKLADLSPEETAKIRQAEMQHREKLLEISNANDQLYLADMQDARKTEIERTKVTGKRDVNLYVLAWTVVVSFFITCGILIFVKMPEGQSNIVYMLLGTLGTGFITVLSYFFGSSKGSADKTVLLAEKTEI